MNSSYITSAKYQEQLPTYQDPEVAFLGRSNCGKSSLLNALLQRRNLARTSSTPGRTQMVNFFLCEPKENEKIIFVDLPGWGFNTAGREVQREWQDLLASYVERKNIRDFLFLLDVRRDLEDYEWQYLTFLAQKTSLALVLTKTDKVNRRAVELKIQELTSQFAGKNVSLHGIFPVSSMKNTGIKELQTFVLRPAGL